MNNYMRNTFYILSIAAMAIMVDQITKSMVFGYFNLSGKSIIEVTPFFNLVLVNNYGISFGAFSSPEYNQWLFIVISTLIAMIFFIWCLRSNDSRNSLPSGLIIGGALGNVIDRIHYGKVIDFLNFHYGTIHFPAFNIADTAIFIGVVILIFLPNEKKSEDEITQND